MYVQDRTARVSLDLFTVRDEQAPGSRDAHKRMYVHIGRMTVCTYGERERELTWYQLCIQEELL